MPNNIIDKIRVSGTDYTLSATTSGVSVVEVTQAEYDALPSSAKTDTSKMYVITDAEAGDLTNYYTKTEVDNAITAATSTKQDTLVSGTNIKTINNISILGSGNIDIQGGGGGGKAIEAGRGISVTTGETADTVSFNLPISANTNNSVVMGGKLRNSFTNNGTDCLMVGSQLTANNGSDCCLVVGYRSSVNGDGSAVIGWNSKSVGDFSFAFGYEVSATTSNSFATGYGTITKNNYEHTSGRYNVSSTGSTDADKTLFSVGNGTSSSARHNAFEIRQNGDIYLSYGGTDIKLQDHLGGGGGGGKAIEAGRGIAITTGETADTINCTLPITTSNNNRCIITGVEGTKGSAEGMGTYESFITGRENKATNYAEATFGRYNRSNHKSDTFGDSGNTLFSVGNGTGILARHNAFEIRQNGDIYLSNGTNDVKLQDYIQIKAVKISQSDYDQLQTKDPNTLYIITTT